MVSTQTVQAVRSVGTAVQHRKPSNNGSQRELFELADGPSFAAFYCRRYAHHHVGVIESYPAIGKAVELAQDERLATGACTRRIAVTCARFSLSSTQIRDREQTGDGCQVIARYFRSTRLCALTSPLSKPRYRRNSPAAPTSVSNGVSCASTCPHSCIPSYPKGGRSAACGPRAPVSAPVVQRFRCWHRNHGQGHDRQPPSPWAMARTTIYQVSMSRAGVETTAEAVSPVQYTDPMRKHNVGAFTRIVVVDLEQSIWTVDRGSTAKAERRSPLYISSQVDRRPQGHMRRCRVWRINRGLRQSYKDETFTLATRRWSAGHVISIRHPGHLNVPRTTASQARAG